MLAAADWEFFAALTTNMAFYASGRAVLFSPFRFASDRTVFSVICRSEHFGSAFKARMFRHCY
jgi:hypothetical protein